MSWLDWGSFGRGGRRGGVGCWDEAEAEEAARRETGLSRADFAAIQDKLVGAALTKAATPENRRAGSIRRRRPSTSQSNYSYSGERVSDG